MSADSLLAQWSCMLTQVFNLRLRLAKTCVNLRYLALTCVWAFRRFWFLAFPIIAVLLVFLSVKNLSQKLFKHTLVADVFSAFSLFLFHLISHWYIHTPSPRSNECCLIAANRLQKKTLSTLIWGRGGGGGIGLSNPYDNVSALLSLIVDWRLCDNFWF